MIGWAVAALVGAVVARRGNPTTAVKKQSCIGPRSGLEYEVDNFTSAGVIVVHCPYAIATFERLPDYGFRYVRGEGDPQYLALMIKDFHRHPEKKPEPAQPTDK